MEPWLSPQILIALATLTGLEIVLGIDNIVFIAILAGKLPEHQRSRAYQIGMAGALVLRVVLLLSIKWVMGLTWTVFTAPIIDEPISWRDMILIAGGLFLIWKSSNEIYEKIEHHEHNAEKVAQTPQKFASVVTQIILMDVIFSLDLVITAVGMVEHIEVMIAAVVIAMAIMLIFARRVGEFVNRNPSLKVLALAFLLLIGVLLTAEGFGQHLNKGYIYFAMAFSLTVELLNLRRNKKAAAAA